MKLIKILSLNVRGLRNHVKRRALFLYRKNQKTDFYCLQETFSLKMKSLGLQNEVGKYFSRMVQNILKVLAYCRDQTPSFILNVCLLIQTVDLLSQRSSQVTKVFFLLPFMLHVIPNNNLCLYKIYVQILSLRQTRPGL